MKLSWSHKLFLRINEQVGKRPIVDGLMIFFARWLIYILVGLYLWFMIEATSNRALAEAYLSSLGIVLIGMFGIHWLIARMVKRPRPHVEFPRSMQLVNPLQNYKSFPSDHTAVAFLFAIISTTQIGFPIGIGFIVLAFFIAISRVYVGVHYPRDIIGGMISGILFSFVVAIMTL